MDILLQGILLGLALSIMAGPILVALLQAGVEQGFRAGIAVGSGVWVSDLLYVLSVYYGIAYVMEATSWPGFELTLGVFGGIILMAFGVGTILSSPSDFTKHTVISYGSYPKLFMKGFLINTINPFTIFFWISVMSAVVLRNDFDKIQTFIFFSGLIGTIILSDSLKVVLAKFIRHKMEHRHLVWMRRIAGAALFIFGVALIIRVLA